MPTETLTSKLSYIEITPDKLPLHCPIPEHAPWNSHPRVFLPIEKTGEERCPYCGTLYKLKGKPHPHHF